MVWYNGLHINASNFFKAPPILHDGCGHLCSSPFTLDLQYMIFLYSSAIYELQNKGWYYLGLNVKARMAVFLLEM